MDYNSGRQDLGMILLAMGFSRTLTVLNMRLSSTERLAWPCWASPRHIVLLEDNNSAF